MFQPRPHQQEILSYTRGTMAVSAVPGSGKTHTLAYLAAQIIACANLTGEQEVLIVTLVNSAVDNFSLRVASFLEKDFRLLPNVGYRVRTLHGLAHDIVRERPALVGLSEDFPIIDQIESDQICRDCAAAWFRGHPQAFDEFWLNGLEEYKKAQYLAKGVPGLIEKIASEFIRTAKDLRLNADQAHRALAASNARLALAEMGCEIYAAYQRALSYRGAVDFDDLIRLALEALQRDDKLLERRRQQWPFILEDEAQDSNRVQEELLRLLAGPRGNWIRVGDPNQAIFETFTNADPRLFLQFKKEAEHTYDLPNSGRSTESIMGLANYLMDWTGGSHPRKEVRDALVLPHILPTPSGDPQPNPPDNPAGIRIVASSLTAEEELAKVLDSLQQWLPDHSNSTVAVLVPDNDRGHEVIRGLKERKLTFVDSLLRSTSSTQTCAGVMGNILIHLANPIDPGALSVAYKVWRRVELEDEATAARVQQLITLLKQCPRVEDYLWPTPGADWLAGLSLSSEDYEELVDFRRLVQHWQGAALLPIDQLVITIAQDLFTQPSDLATAHKMASLLRRSGQLNPGWQLRELVQELKLIAKDERRFIGLSEDDTGFNPDRYQGRVVVSTIHKAKGLEWDRVYLMSVNNSHFPSGVDGDEYFSERYYIRDSLNLPAEAIAQLHAIAPGGERAEYGEGEATEQARLDNVRERLRLLYVAITRAKQELRITWNKGDRPNRPKKPAEPLMALNAYWGEHRHGTAR
jgi:DNA helicase-2/ATP-dependent DNA helicase PcrA